MKDKLIIHSVTRLYLGGAQRICLDILDYLNNQGYDVLLLTGPPEEMSEEVARKGLPVKYITQLIRPISPLNDIIAFIKTLSLMKSLKKQYREIHVHTHSSKAGIIVRWAASIAGIRNIYHTAHGWAFYPDQNMIKRKLFILIERLTSKITKNIIAVSQATKDYGLKQNIACSSKIKVIYNNVRIKKKHYAKEEIYRKLNIDKSKKVILQVSCLKEQKDPIQFLGIAEKLRIRDDLLFLLAGDGILRSDLEEYIDKKNLQNIKLLGWYHNIAELYSIASVITLTSKFEGFPLVIIEASRFYLPVIASDIPNHREFLDNKFLCRRDDIACYEEKINSVLKSKQQLEPIYFENMLQYYENLYKFL